MKSKLLVFIAALAILAATFPIAQEYAFAAESKVNTVIEYYSGEWKAAPSNPSLTAPANVLDGDPNTSWYCQWGKADDIYGDAPNMILGLGGERTVSRVEVNMPEDYVPQEVVVYVGDDSDRWAEAGRFQDIAIRQTLVCYVPNQRATKVKVTVMKKSVPDGNGFTLAKISDIKVFETTAAPLNGLVWYSDVTTGATLNSSAAGLTPEALSDGAYTVYGQNGGSVVDAYYTDYSSDSADCDITVAYSFASAKELSAISLWPRTFAGNIFGFPEDFAVVYSPNSTDWYVVSGQTYFGYSPVAGENFFAFDSKISAMAVGIKVVKKTTERNGSYAVSLNEMRVFSSSLTGEAVEPRPNDTADSSAITAGEISGGEFEAGDTLSITLSDYFESDSGSLTYSHEGIGSIADGVYIVTFEAQDVGRHTVTVMASLNPFCTAQITFIVTVSAEDMRYVTAPSAAVSRTITEGGELELDLKTLFVYSGEGSLVYTADGTPVQNGVLKLSYAAEGSYQTQVRCYPVGASERGAEISLTVTVRKSQAPLQSLTIGESLYSAPSYGYVLAAVISAVISAVAVAVVLTLVRRRGR